jgi:hypothetical protein
MKERTKPVLIFLVIGVLLLFVSYLLRPTSPQTDSFFSSAFSNAAFVLLTVAMVDWLWGLLGGEPISKTLIDLKQSFHLFDMNMQSYIDIIGDSHKAGVMRIFSHAGEFEAQSIWMRRLEAAQHEVDLMGYTLQTWATGHNFVEEILKLVQKGVKVRVLIMDETNPSFDSILSKSQTPDPHATLVRAELQQSKKIFNEIELLVRDMKTSHPSGSFELLAVQKGLIMCHICRIDDKMVVIAYLYCALASLSPLMVIQGQKTKMFEVYQKQFEQLWTLNKP